MENIDNTIRKALTEVERDNNGANFNNWMDVLKTSSFGMYFELEDGSIIGHANTEDWDNAKWYHKIIGWFWRGYKNRFIKPEPFKAKHGFKI